MAGRKKRAADGRGGRARRQPAEASWVTHGPRADGGKRGIAALVGAVADWFPERQLVIRARGRVAYLTLSRPMQIGVLAAAMVVAGWSTYVSLYYFSFDWILRQKNQQIAEARIAYRNVMDEVDAYNTRLLEITRNLERSQLNLLSRLESDVAGARAIDSARRHRLEEIGRAVAAATRGPLTKQIEALEANWRELAARNATLEHGLASIGSEVESILAENGEVKRERDSLRNRVGSLEAALADLRVTQEALLDRLSARTTATIDEIQKVITMAGLDPDKLVARAAEADGETGGQGGPYIEVAGADDDPIERKIAQLDNQLTRWRYLHQVFSELPLIAPVDNYRLASRFGRRRDPITKRWALHYGVDLSYRLNTPILSPAPGTVVFRGWRGGMGWTLEIDHGMGIRTRYGHLKKILVKRGQEVGFREKIALMGTSGRSTGTHVHYEILVDGKPVDPLKFIKAGKYVFKG